MNVIHDAAGLLPFHGGLFIPTMGALHEGHSALIREGARRRDLMPSRPPVIVSIFVNPTQFNDPTDLDRYPRTLRADVEGCKIAGADAIFAPPVGEIYPPETTIPPPTLPAVATEPKLEDALRPGHFAGVCQVVKRLFDLVRPTAAFFGEKDWQQLQVLAALTRQERLPIEIVPVPTAREPDGLAMSSRNRFLLPEERAPALALFRALHAASDEAVPAAAEARMRSILLGQGLAVEYAVVRDATTLLPMDTKHPARPARALIAARLKHVRLIDNAPWPTR